MHFNGILKPKSGKILYNGEEIKYNRTELTKLRKNVGIVFKILTYSFFCQCIPRDFFWTYEFGLSRNIVKEKVEKAMKQMRIIDLKDKPTHF